MSEIRHFSVQFRAAAPAEGADAAETAAGEGILIGYASVFDVEYRIGYGLKETIKAGAFADSIKAQAGVIPVFYEHDWNDPIGFATASEDKTGVHVEANLFIEDNPKARSVWRAAQAGALREWSIGYRPETISFDSEDSDVEIVERGELIEASVCVRGANPNTTMDQVRSKPPAEDAELDTPEEMAEWVSEAVERGWYRDMLRSEF